MSDWQSGARGHVGNASKRFKSDASQRAAAEKSQRSIILTPEQVRGERWDATKVLSTTLGGKSRSITSADLEAFRRNISTARQRSGFDGEGITARQVINLAEHDPLKYRSEHGSDLFKARTEINKATPVSALKGEVRFLTNAGGESRATFHHVVVQFNGFPNALTALSETAADEGEKAVANIVNTLKKGKLKFDCDCERHRYFLRYVATIGGFNAGRDETGFPKIRNPGVKGVACKHVLRVMAEIESSQIVARFLSRHLLKVTKANQSGKRTQATQEELKKSHNKKEARIKVDTKEALARKAKRAELEREALAKAESGKPARQWRASPASRRAEAEVNRLIKNAKGKGVTLTSEEAEEILGLRR